jgi:hypothetical protein
MICTMQIGLLKKQATGKVNHLLETTIFYPADGFSSAEELATQTGGTPVEATPDMSQTALTLVIIQ